MNAPINTQTILDNKHGRETAHEIAQLARLETISMREQSRLRFWESLRDEIAKELPQAPTPRQMTDAELKAFGREKMRYGIHGGAFIDEVPIGYLDWLVRDSFEFLNKVRQYLNSPRIQAEREE